VERTIPRNGAFPFWMANFRSVRVDRRETIACGA
jgi:hypothetical protein